MTIVGWGKGRGGKRKKRQREREKNNSTVNSSGFGNWLGSMMTALRGGKKKKEE